MQEHKRSIFRNESLQHYLARQEPSVFPQLVQPRRITILWLILILTVVSSLLILLKGVPISLSVARARFGLTEKDCSSIQFPASVVLAHPTGADLEVFQTGDRNSAYLSFIPRGSQRAISYLFTINDGVNNQLR